MDMRPAGKASSAAAGVARPLLGLSQILQMNLGFLGLQFSFGLQQGNMGPIYSYLGAGEASLPILQIAGPLSGLLVQPIVGAMSDRTLSRWGRRTPYFLVGALMCGFGLFFMPLSASIVMAVSLMIILDVGNNVTMEPYRAYVKDRLDERQHGVGFLSQSAFTGLAQTLAFLTPSLLVYGLGIDRDAVDSHNIPTITRLSFHIGAALSLLTILWSVSRVPELPLTSDERARIAALPRTVAATFGEIGHAIAEMPAIMRRMALMSLFQWYAMISYWNYVVYSISRSVYATHDPASAGFREAVLSNGQMAAFYNFVAFLAAFAMTPLSRRFGADRMHALCLTLAGLGMLALPHVGDKSMLFAPAIGIGLGWASIMGNPYILLAGAIPPERTGVYMGIFNMFIVIPMILHSLSMPLVYASWFGGDARNVLSLAGVLMFGAAASALTVVRRGKPSTFMAS